jgi:hypothetical protein
MFITADITTPARSGSSGTKPDDKGFAFFLQSFDNSILEPEKISA